MTDSKKIYSKMAANYGDVSKKKSSYIESVDKLIIHHAPNIINYYLDAGGGDGARTLKISKNIGANYTVLIDNSEEMIRLAKKQKLDEVHCKEIASYSSIKKFDLITSLWNVFGHIETKKERIDSLVNLCSHLSENGLLMVDVNNRYNIDYGYKNVFKNILLDLSPVKSDNHGWFSFKFKDKKFPVYLHSPLEIMSILHKAGLVVCAKYGVNYYNGEISDNYFFKGQMFFVAKRK